MLYDLDSNNLFGGYYEEQTSDDSIEEKKQHGIGLALLTKNTPSLSATALSLDLTKKKQWWIARSDLTECIISGGPSEKLDSFLGYVDRQTTKDYMSFQQSRCHK